MNHPEILYSLGSLGALLSLFGGFLILWRRFQAASGGRRLPPRTRGVAWSMLLLGAALVALALSFAPPIPSFTP